METTTPFDLNQAVQRWRQELAQSPAFHAEDLDELETHLRDSVVGLQAHGLSPDESVLIAARRPGKRAALENEFGKVNTKSVWLDRLLWMLIGVQVWGLASGFIHSLARNGFALGWRSINYDWKTHGMALPVTLFALAQALAFLASIGFCWWLIHRQGGRLYAWFTPWLKRRSAFVAFGFALCLLALLVTAFSQGLSLLLFWSTSPQVAGEAAMYSSYSQLFVSPLQMAALIALTLALARKRIYSGQTWPGLD